MCLRLMAMLAIAGAPFAGGCATLLTPRDPPLSIVVIAPLDSAGVRHSDGRILGMAPVADLRLRPRGALEFSRPGWTPRRQPLRRSLRTSFGMNAYVPGVLALGALEAGAEPRTVLLLGLAAVPAGALVDLLTGRAWKHEPRVLEVRMERDSTSPPPPTPSPAPPSPTPPTPLPTLRYPPPDPGALFFVLFPAPPLPRLPLDVPALAVNVSAPPDPRAPELPDTPAYRTAAATLLLRGMAQAADSAGCNPIVSQTWLDRADRATPRGAIPAGDWARIGHIVRARVAGIRAQLAELCARSNPLLDSLGAIQARLAEGVSTPDPADAEMTPEQLCRASGFGHCITFATGSSTLRPAFQAELEEMAAQIRSVRLAVTVIVVGTADPSPDRSGNQRLGLARATAVRDALVRLGVPAERLAVESCGDEPRCQLVPGATGTAPGAELNRRVLFHLRTGERQP